MQSLPFRFDSTVWRMQICRDVRVFILCCTCLRVLCVWSYRAINLPVRHLHAMRLLMCSKYNRHRTPSIWYASNSYFPKPLTVVDIHIICMLDHSEKCTSNRTCGRKTHCCSVRASFSRSNPATHTPSARIRREHAPMTYVRNDDCCTQPKAPNNAADFHQEKGLPPLPLLDCSTCVLHALLSILDYRTHDLNITAVFVCMRCLYFSYVHAYIHNKYARFECDIRAP